MELSTLQPGQSLLTERLILSPGGCAAYREAVEDGCGIHPEERLVPSMAVAALVMGAAMRAVQLPAGAVHTGQELQFSREVPVGATLECSASVAQNSVRQGIRFLTLELQALSDGEPAMSGRTSIVIQEGREGAAD